MKIRSVRLLKILLITLPIVLLCVPILRVVVANADIVYPRPVTQSAFLKNYSPADTIAPFSIEGSGAQQSVPGGSSAGHGCAFHEKEFRSLFVIASGNGTTLMTDVQRDIKSSLARQGAQIVTEVGHGPERVQFDYTAGRSKGTVAVEPIAVIDSWFVDPSEQLPPGEVAIELRVRIEETWYKASEKVCRKL